MTTPRLIDNAGRCEVDLDSIQNAEARALVEELRAFEHEGRLAIIDPNLDAKEEFAGLLAEAKRSVIPRIIIGALFRLVCADIDQVDVGWELAASIELAIVRDVEEGRLP